MDGQTVERLPERGSSLRHLTSPQSDGPYRVPRVGAAFARIQVTAALAGEFPVEVLERARFIAFGESDQPAQPVERDACKASRATGLGALGVDAGAQLAFGLAQGLSRHMHGGR